MINIKKSNKGAIAMIMVIMVTALTVVSAVVVSMTNISDMMSSYSFGEAEGVDMEMDACLEDAMFRLASSTSASGTYYLSSVGIDCYYEIGSSIVDGIKTVTSTASSTTDNIGWWQDTIVVQVNVENTPIKIESYKHSNISYDTFTYCGDGQCGDDETCSNCSDDCGVCTVCGNGIPEWDEVCDDGPEDCGDGVVQNGTYCNDTCTAVDKVMNEGCDWTGSTRCSGAPNAPFENAVNCTKNPLCNDDCSSCTSMCPSF